MMYGVKCGLYKVKHLPQKCELKIELDRLFP